ncbi:tetratricopeptide repeat protein [Paraburkholderia edwinii]|uniref:Tetratricopeptide repeat protein n=1 Tax=Paraburkholderia edwinii TaxID=2861782 RepID=A0ABX8UUY9_9BURK|nr:tetratricopeptide repeat protein [Paraburkholderia edwinii]QYD72825.1 tetratricopeptide repeat protein [Paraburkholderia edwinii]
MVSEAGRTTLDAQGGAHTQPAAGVAGGGAASAARAPSTLADDAMKRARAFHERGALDDAERVYGDVLQAEPEHAEALHFLGVLHFQRGRMEDADAVLSRSVEQSPSALALANHASVLTALGRREDALAQLDAALRINPAHPRALLLQAGLLMELGRPEEALDAYDRLLKLVPTTVDLICGRAAVLRALSRSQEALDASERALRIDPRSFNAHRQRGDALRDLRRFVDALDAYGRALSVVPNSAEVLLMQGLTLADLGRLDAALSSLNEAIAGKPDYVDAIYNSAVLLERLGRNDDALSRCDRVLALNARHAAALANKGNVLHSLERYEESLASYDASLEIAPASIETWCNRTQTLVELRKLPEALESCDRAIALNDQYKLAWYYRGRVLQRLHRYEEAIVDHDRVLEIDPEHRPALFQRGNALRSLMRHDEALVEYDHVLALDPDDIATHFSKAFVYLQLGDFDRGWPEYEWRWKEDQVGKYRKAFAQPLWLGEESIEHKTILLHAEQGLGDTLQFCRYVKFVKARGARVIIEVPRALKSIVETVEDVDQVVGQGDPLPPFDVHCPLLSLPLVFRTNLASIPADVPYLKVHEQRVADWQARLGPRTRPRVGVAWSGNPNHLDDHNRSIPLEELLETLPDSVEWISVQKQIRAGEQRLLAASSVRDVSDAIGDFSDTAALMQCLDCVLSVDTSVAHLAGALGRPLWVMLPYLPDWRWLLEREDNPWYPGARLFRQTQAGEWGDVFERINAALQSAPWVAAPAALSI